LLGREVRVEVARQQVDAEREVTSSSRSTDRGIRSTRSTEINVMLRATPTNTVWYSPMWRIGGCCAKNSSVIVSLSNWRDG
jgi:hypothetical protein